MKKIIMLVIVGLLGWYGYQKMQRADHIDPGTVYGTADTAAVDAPASKPRARFQCDGRTHCSQMRSCAEATYFIRNCPNTKMDGDGDGVPCERQWCS